MKSKASRSSAIVWAGQIVSGLTVMLLVLDAFGKITQVAPVVQGTAQLGYPTHLVSVIGFVELLCVVTYLIPRSSLVRAVLLTGYFGGAVATDVRIEDPLWTHALAPIYMAVAVWGGLLMREDRLRQLMPVRRRPVVA